MKTFTLPTCCAFVLLAISDFELRADEPATPMVEARRVAELSEVEGYWRSVSFEGGKETERPELVTIDVGSKGETVIRAVGAEETLTIKGTLAFADGKGSFRWDGEAEGSPSYMWLDAHGRLISYDKLTKTYITLERVRESKSK